MHLLAFGVCVLGAIFFRAQAAGAKLTPFFTALRKKKKEVWGSFTDLVFSSRLVQNVPQPIVLLCLPLHSARVMLATELSLATARAALCTESSQFSRLRVHEDWSKTLASTLCRLHVCTLSLFLSTL